MDNTQAEKIREGLNSFRLGGNSPLNDEEIEELFALFQTEKNQLLDAVVADAPKDNNHPHKMFSNDLVEAYADGFDRANAQWREVIERHKVKERK